MPYHEQDKFIFIHIPKTGGTSVENAFNITSPENFCFYRWDLDQPAFLEKYGAKAVSDKLHYEPQHYTSAILKQLISGYDSYFKFTFVRNPYTRLLSEYFWLHGKKLINYSDFSPLEFQHWCHSFLAEINSSHKEPQSVFLDDSINFIGKYENLITDFEILKDRLSDFSPNLKKLKDLSLPRMNETGLDKTQLIPYLLPETKQLICRVYGADFEAFSYEPLLKA